MQKSVDCRLRRLLTVSCWKIPLQTFSTASTVRLRSEDFVCTPKSKFSQSPKLSRNLRLSWLLLNRQRNNKCVNVGGRSHTSVFETIIRSNLLDDNFGWRRVHIGVGVWTRNGYWINKVPSVEKVWKMKIVSSSCSIISKNWLWISYNSCNALIDWTFL